jgi:hypothetical protein
MAEEDGVFKIRPRKLIFKVLKAMIKGLLFYVLYYVCWMFLAPFATMIPNLQQTLETFVAVYITLVVIGELTAGTIYQHFFGVANALFVISTLILSLNSGIISMAFQNVALQVDVSLFLVIATILSFVGLSKTMLQTINFASRKAENTQT